MSIKRHSDHLEAQEGNFRNKRTRSWGRIPLPDEDTASLSSSSEDTDSDITSDDESTSSSEAKEPLQQPLDLRARLQTFIPSLAAANQDIERVRASGSGTGYGLEIPDEEDDENGSSEQLARRPYIEMNLGLGVLEEREDGVKLADSDTSSDVSGEEDGSLPTDAYPRNGRGDTVLHDLVPNATPREMKGNGLQEDVLGKLLGKRGSVRRSQIQEVS